MNKIILDIVLQDELVSDVVFQVKIIIISIEIKIEPIKGLNEKQ